MNNLKIRKALNSDIELLIKLRIDFLNEGTGNLTADEEHITKEKLSDYYTRHIDSDFIAALAEIDEQTVAVAFLVIFEVPVNPRYFVTGKKALIINVLTYPEYRRQGIATKLLELLIDEAKKADVTFIELSATTMGKSVYEKLGFKEKQHSDYTAMRLNLN